MRSVRQAANLLCGIWHMGQRLLTHVNNGNCYLQSVTVASLSRLLVRLHVSWCVQKLMFTCRHKRQEGSCLPVYGSQRSRSVAVPLQACKGSHCQTLPDTLCWGVQGLGIRPVCQSGMHDGLLVCSASHAKVQPAVIAETFASSTSTLLLDTVRMHNGKEKHVYAQCQQDVYGINRL